MGNAFSGINAQRAKNVRDTLSESMREIRDEVRQDCPSSITQRQDFDQVAVDCGGDVNLSQTAVIDAQCIQQSTNQQEIFRKLAEKTAQKLTTDAGPDSFVSLVNLSDQQNVSKLETIIKDNYSTLNAQACDTSIFQSQRWRNVNIRAGGDCDLSQFANISLECRQIANIERKIADEYLFALDQAGALKGSFGLTEILIIAGIALVAVVVLAVVIRAIVAARGKRANAFMTSFYGQQQQPMQYYAAAGQQQQQQPYFAPEAQSYYYEQPPAPSQYYAGDESPPPPQSPFYQ